MLGHVVSGRRSSSKPWRNRSIRLALFFLLLLSLLVHFTGIASEIGDLYVGDEGQFREGARKIVEGEIFRPWFIYPHLLFYVDAAALWITDHLKPVVPTLVRWTVGLERPRDLDALVLRWVTALFGALTIVPVFWAAKRLAGLSAAVCGGLSAVFSSLFVEICHENISDVPSAFFSALTLSIVARLAARESSSAYAWAGLAAGLAAGSKYPAGLVAIAIVSVWFGWRIRTRSFSVTGLGLSAGVAVVSFLAATPSLLVYPRWVFRGRGADILFGLRQYAGKGWLGVVPESQSAFYALELAANFGWIVLLVGLAGFVLFLVRAGGHGKIALHPVWLLAYPVVAFLLLVRMNIAVHRNLMPLLPWLAVFLGVGTAELGRVFIRRVQDAMPTRTAQLRGLAALLLATALAEPALATTRSLIRFSRPTTREISASWIFANMPEGTMFLRETYTPYLATERFVQASKRYVWRFKPALRGHPEVDVIMVADGAYGRYFAAEDGSAEAARLAAFYRNLLRTHTEIAQFQRERLRIGPRIVLLEAWPRDVRPPPVDSARFRFGESWSIGPLEESPEGLRAGWDSRLLIKAELAPGSYVLELSGGGLERAAAEALRFPNGEPLELFGVGGGSTWSATIEERGRYFFYAMVPSGALVESFSLRRSDAVSGAEREIEG